MRVRPLNDVVIVAPDPEPVLAKFSDVLWLPRESDLISGIVVDCGRGRIMVKDAHAQDHVWVWVPTDLEKGQRVWWLRNLSHIKSQKTLQWWLDQNGVEVMLIRMPDVLAVSEA